MSHTRANCSNCKYPVKICLCAAIKPVDSKHTIIILQHPSEVKHAKGSARLVDLCIKGATIICGQSNEDFAPLQQAVQQSQKTCYLVYPQEGCQFVESMDKQCEPCTLIFIDGSWKKSYKLLQLNTWLTQLPCISFVDADKSRYQIRKAHRPDSLSTLEAVAYCLDNLDDVDTSPLHQAFDAMIDNQWRFMSDTVKQRYK